MSNNALETDVYPLLSLVREELGIHPDPVSVYHCDNYAAKIANERRTAEAGGDCLGS